MAVPIKVEQNQELVFPSCCLELEQTRKVLQGQAVPGGQGLEHRNNCALILCFNIAFIGLLIKQ